MDLSLKARLIHMINKEFEKPLNEVDVMALADRIIIQVEPEEKEAAITFVEGFTQGVQFLNRLIQRQ